MENCDEDIVIKKGKRLLWENAIRLAANAARHPTLWQ